MNLEKIKIWAVTDGSQGMVSQVMGLSKQISSNITEIKTDLIFPWNKIQPGFLPTYKWIFKNNFPIYNEPNILISCGRKSVYFSLYCKKKFKKILNIHIQNPKVSLQNFDFVVVPDHDSIDGPNVLISKGAIHYLTIDEINNAKNYLENKIEKGKDVITLILGGPTKYYNYSKENIIQIFSKINKQILEKNLQLILIPSNRTPENTIKFAKEYFNKDRLVVEGIDKKATSVGSNPIKLQ